MSENVYDRQQTVRQLHLCPNCLTEHPKGQCNSKYRCQVDNCNGFHHSTIHRNNFNTTQPSSQGQNQSTSEYRHNGDNLNRNQFNFTNNSSSWNKNLSSSNPNCNHQTRQNGNSGYNRQRSRSRYNSNNNNNYNNNSSINSNNSTNGSYNNSNSYNRHNRNFYYGQSHQVPNTSNVQRQQPTSGNFNQQYQHSTDRNSQSFSGSNNRHQNYTCSNNQPSSWIRPPVQLQAIPVTVFSETVSIETYALLDSGSDNTQITKTIADALGIRDRKCVTIPVASLYQEHTIETTEIFLGIGAIDSSRPIINLPVFATSTTDFQMPTVPIQMLNSVCKDFVHLSDINFPQIRDNKIVF